VEIKCLKEIKNKNDSISAYLVSAVKNNDYLLTYNYTRQERAVK
jgi:hypothetical protein